MMIGMIAPHQIHSKRNKVFNIFEIVHVTVLTTLLSPRVTHLSPRALHSYIF